jgi:predicted RNA-binding Zn ribbon-like protein
MAITGDGPLSRERAGVEREAKAARDKQEAALATIDGNSALPMAIEWLRERKRDELSTQPSGDQLAAIASAHFLERIEQHLAKLVQKK